MATVFQFKAIGTMWHIEIKDSLSQERESFILEKIHAKIATFDSTYSRFRSDSIIAQIASTPGLYALPEDSEELFSMYRTFYDATEGKVTPLIGGVLVSAGYDAAYTLAQTGALETPPPWDEVMSYAPHTLTVHAPIRLDFGAGGKGYLIDSVGLLLEEECIAEYYINAGGDIRHCTESADVLRVGLENPFDFSEVLGVARLHNMSMCASAGSRRAWGVFHHIIDPVALVSPRHIAAVWVLARSTFLADMLTTALFFVPPELLQEQFSFEYAILYDTMTMTRSRDFGAEFFNAQ